LDRGEICIITQSHLCRNPRVLKEAVALAAEGHEVHIINCIYSADLLAQDKELIKDYRINLHHAVNLTKTGYTSFLDKLVFKLGRSLIKYSGIESPIALGYGSYKYYSLAKSINADLYICHQELATFIGGKLLQNGFKTAFDFEDWYSEDLLPADRKQRPVQLLKKAEAFALKNGTYCTTTSEALAEKLSITYKCTAPEVIYNVFPLRTDLLNKKKEFAAPLKLFWFSQTIGPGRGLEEFIRLSANFKTGLEFHLLGYISAVYQKELKILLPTQHRMFLHKLLPENELASKIATFDIGLALELSTPPSRYYTITNKFFQYIQAGLPVIANKTAGQHEAFEKFRPGFTLSGNPTTDEIAALVDFLNSPLKLNEARGRAIEAAHFYKWKNESRKLIHLIKTALEPAG
jgi:glycosyltransferase involved in cell wall biosynthesis